VKRVIALTGTKGSGKDTFCQFLSAHLSGRFDVTYLRFAGLLKQACAKASGLSGEYFEDAVLKEQELPHPIKFNKESFNIVMKEFDLPTDGSNDNFMVFKTPRKMLQVVGTDILRRKKPTIHVDKTISKIPQEGVSIITDMRFVNEFNALEKSLSYHEFIPVFLSRSTGSNDEHKSERELLKFKEKCVIIDNNGTLEDLSQKALKVASVVLKGRTNVNRTIDE